MKRGKQYGLLLLVLLLTAAMLFGCSAASRDGIPEDNGRYGYTNDGAEKSGEDAAGTATAVTSDRKIIEYITLTVETQTFDRLTEDIQAAVERAGGYIESSKLEGNRYYGADSRSAQMKIRVPKAKQADLSAFIAENANVVDRSVDTDDVTDQYIDTQSRIKALTLEKETLEKLLTQAKSVADTLTIYEKLTAVITEIESYQGKLNRLDNLVEYTTFTLYINEVERETPVSRNWFERTRDDLLANFADVGSGLLAICSFLIAALPYWLLLGAAALIIVLIVRRCRKKKQK